MDLPWKPLGYNSFGNNSQENPSKDFGFSAINRSLVDLPSNPLGLTQLHDSHVDNTSRPLGLSHGILSSGDKLNNVDQERGITENTNTWTLSRGVSESNNNIEDAPLHVESNQGNLDSHSFPDEDMCNSQKEENGHESNVNSWPLSRGFFHFANESRPHDSSASRLNNMDGEILQESLNTTESLSICDRIDVEEKQAAEDALEGEPVEEEQAAVDALEGESVKGQKEKLALLAREAVEALAERKARKARKEQEALLARKAQLAVLAREAVAELAAKKERKARKEQAAVLSIEA
ncbi:hypothetical protein PVNG_00790, partial [Plasmodium vivax North Korean]